MKTQAIRFLRNNIPRHRKSVFVKYARRLSQFAYRIIENDNYDLEKNGEQNVLNTLSKHSDVRTVFDVGANVGNYVLAAAKAFPKAKVYAFEPVRKTFEELNRRIAGAQNVVSFNYGLSERDERIEFKVCTANSEISSAHGAVGALLNPRNDWTTEPCLLRKGSTLVEEFGISRIDFLKIDTEGHDWFVLSGFSDWLKAGKIGAIQFEYGLCCISTRRLLLDYYTLLTAHGYRVGKIFPTFVDFKEYHPLDEDFIGPNFLAVHQSTGLWKNFG